MPLREIFYISRVLVCSSMCHHFRSRTPTGSGHSLQSLLLLLCASYVLLFAPLLVVSANSIPQVPGDYTMQYFVTYSDLKSSNTKAQMVGDFKIDMANNPHLTEMVKSFTDGLNQPSKQLWLVTISSFQGKLLYQCQVLKGSHNNDRLVIYDGTKTYRFLPGDKSKGDINSSLYVYPGMRLSEMLALPFPGANLHQLAFVKNYLPDNSVPKDQTDDADALMTLSQKLKYLPCRYTTTSKEGLLRLDKVVVPLQGRTLEEWDFTKSKIHRNIWIASEMTYLSAISPFQSTPETRYDYKLKRLSDVPLPQSNFEPGNLLKENDLVEDMSGGNTIGFNFDPSNGNLDQQTQRQAVMNRLRSQRPVQNSAKSGVLLLVGLILLGAAWLFRRMRRVKTGQNNADAEG